MNRHPLLAKYTPAQDRLQDSHPVELMEVGSYKGDPWVCAGFWPHEPVRHPSPTKCRADAFASAEKVTTFSCHGPYGLGLSRVLCLFPGCPS